MASERTEIRMVHRVLPAHPTAFGLPSAWRLRGTALTPDELLASIDAPVVPLEAIVDALEAGEAPPPGVALTFDDGYQEWPAVAELLATKGHVASWFLCGAYRADAERAHPVDLYYWLLDHAERPVLRVHLPTGTVEARVDDLEHKRWLVAESPLKRAIVHGEGVAALLARVSESLDVAPPEDLASRLYLPVDGRAVLSRVGNIGAHGRSHRWMTTLDDETLAAELDPAGLSTHVVAWPDGAWDGRTVAAARRLGYRAALTCEPGPVRRGADPMRLPRVFVLPPEAGCR